MCLALVSLTEWEGEQVKSIPKSSSSPFTSFKLTCPTSPSNPSSLTSCTTFLSEIVSGELKLLPSPCSLAAKSKSAAMDIGGVEPDE